jgi:pimeloyl-ACP methyl ester carboxylesterase
MMRARFQRLSGLPNVFLPGVLLAGWVLTGVHLNSLKPAEVAARVKAKMLVIHSAGDSWIPKHHALALAAATRSETWITPGKKHLASFREHPEEYAIRVIAFFEQHLTPWPQGMHPVSSPNKPIAPVHPDSTLVHADSSRHLQP